MINTKRLRCTIGWLGIALPWLVMLIVGYVPNSISATYYTNAQAVFMIILGSASFLLFSYKGYETVDDIINSIAGFFGLCICLFPCSVPNTHGIRGTFDLPMSLSNDIHCVSAFIFFTLLAVNSAFLFTKTSGHMTKKKKIRNVIYRVCGGVMFLAFLPLAFKKLINWDCLMWLIETIALLAFGISFLTKANCYPWLASDKE